MHEEIHVSSGIGQMGNHAPANSLIALAERSPESNRLSEDAIRHLVDHFYTKVRADFRARTDFRARYCRRLGTPPRDDARLLVLGDAH